MTLRSLFALAGLVLPLAAFSASFNCEKASTPTESAICASPEVSRLDSQLGTLFSRQKAAFASDDELVASQKQWIKERNNCAGDGACLLRAYQQRILVLETWGSAATPAPEPETPAATNEPRQQREGNTLSDAPAVEPEPVATLAAEETAEPPVQKSRTGIEGGLQEFQGHLVEWATLGPAFLSRHIHWMGEKAVQVSSSFLRVPALLVAIVVSSVYLLAGAIVLLVVVIGLVALIASKQAGIDMGGSVSGGGSGGRGRQPTVVFDDEDVVVLGYQPKGDGTWAVKFKTRGGNGIDTMTVSESTHSGSRGGKSFRVH